MNILFKILLFALCFSLFFGCTKKIVIPKKHSNCLDYALINMDSMITKNEKTDLKSSQNVVSSKKFGVLKVILIREFSLDDSNSCLSMYFSKLGINSVIEKSGALIEIYKKRIIGNMNMNNR